MAFGLPVLFIGLALFFYGLTQLPKSATLSEGGPCPLGAFSIPFSGIGALLIFGPLVYARTAARDIRYTLTTRAAYIQRTGRFPNLKVYPILPSTALEPEPGKRASTIWLHARLERDSDGALETTKAGFENIAEADKVYRMIRDLQA